MIQQLCDQAIWLDAGELVLSGTVKEITAAYTSSGASLPV